MIKIVLDGEVATRNQDEWARTVRDDVRLSAYPLALWFASSWWRLRWEPIPTSSPTHSWRMAHELAAAGYGYVWPRMLFASDGEQIHAWAVQTGSESKSAVRYLTNVYRAIKASDFERAVDDFISSVLARLDAVKNQRTILHNLWSELTAERTDENLTSDRRLEALLGFDPDEGPEALLARLKKLIPSAGPAAVAEIATVCASRDRLSTLEAIVSLAKSAGLRARMALTPDRVTRAPVNEMPGWQRGRGLARMARDKLGLDGAPISDKQLADLIGVPVDKAIEPQGTGRMPLGMAIRGSQARQATVLLRKRNRPGRRFEIARFICDYLLADKEEMWLPVTDEKTSRQKTQRAFAAEFLCPFEPLAEFLSDDFSNDAIDDAAEYFGVSSRAIETQLVNHHTLPPDVLVEDVGMFDFPYFARMRRATEVST